MATFPPGTLMLSGYGDTPFRWYSQGGANLGLPPATQPSNPGGGCSGITTFKDGQIFALGGGWGSLYGTQIWAADMTPSGNPLITAGQQFGVGAAWLSNHVYAANLNTITPHVMRLYKFDASGSSYLSAVDVAVSKPLSLCGPSRRVAISPDDATAYITDDNRFDASAIVWSVAIASGAVSTFATATALETGLCNSAVMTMPDGSVVVGWGDRTDLAYPIRYSAAGAVLNVYSGIPDYSVATELQPAYLSNGSRDPNHFIIGYYNLATSGYGSSFAKVKASDGTIVAHWVPANDGFEWDGPFTVLSVAVVGTSSTVPIDTPEAPTIDCDPQTEVSGGGRGAAGCNTGGIGYTSVGDYDIGGIPEHDDPDAGEQISGKIGVEVWVELVHEGTTYRRAMVPLGDANEGGYKAPGLSAVGVIEHALGNERGGYEPATLSIEMSDVFDNLLRDIIAADDEIEGDELRVKIASDEMRELF